METGSIRIAGSRGRTTNSSQDEEWPKGDTENNYIKYLFIPRLNWFYAQDKLRLQQRLNLAN